MFVLGLITGIAATVFFYRRVWMNREEDFMIFAQALERKEAQISDWEPYDIGDWFNDLLEAYLLKKRPRPRNK